jgi:cytosine/adenosine deaminase-related metal-dependent hydrolase
MKMIYGLNEQSVFSIHNQETAEENDWFKNKQGSFELFYQRLNVDTQHFSSKNKSSLAHLLQYMNPHQRHLLVHNVHISAADLNAAMEHFQSHPEHLFFCLCPQANQYISQQLPDVKLFQQQGVNIILGTDSLASNHQLDLMSEMQLLQHQYPELTMDDMLGWATIQGARALGIDGRYGSFEKGKSPGVVTVHNGKAKLLVSPR